MRYLKSAMILLLIPTVMGVPTAIDLSSTIPSTTNLTSDSAAIATSISAVPTPSTIISSTPKETNRKSHPHSGDNSHSHHVHTLGERAGLDDYLWMNTVIGGVEHGISTKSATTTKNDHVVAERQSPMEKNGMEVLKDDSKPESREEVAKNTTTQKVRRRRNWRRRIHP
ncbi:uncharacterized protein L201_003222 [Kwoniella dendrophila CBS 6074]|uniref:Uncharacterized protein n=1 Tax=Kwoniella dendrophila CBS 6074 TaxID=1295534 RepID=A0AAX4JU22_9TREE